jgi:uncharacterized protein (TIGR02271 family)
MTHETHPSKERGLLPLSARREEVRDGIVRTWTVRLPVRAEQVTVNKQVVVAEEVSLRVDTTQRTVTVEQPIRRERLRVEVDGDVTADQTIAPARR